MIITIRWEDPSWSCYLQTEDGRTTKVETPSEQRGADGHSMERWARRQWPEARVQFDDYLV